MSKAGFVTTFTRKKINYDNFSADDVHIEDIAHALSHVCRFGGHIPRHYSVAEHSLLVAKMVPDDLKLHALLHDASEAYISDIVRPAKRMLPDYMALEGKIERAIFEKYNLDWHSKIHQTTVEVADDKALFIEARSFYGKEEIKSWAFNEEIMKWGETKNKDLMCFAPSPTKIKEQFMNAFLAYGGVK